jgi:hypothetical protein
LISIHDSKNGKLVIASDDAGIGSAVVVKLLRCGGLAIQSRAR